MSSGSYKQVDVICPYYQRDDGKKKIVCDGLQDESTITLCYSNAEAFIRQIDIYCCRNYDKCEIYRALSSIYDE